MTKQLRETLALLVLGFSYMAQAEPFATETEKAQRIKTLIEKYPLKLQRGGGFGDHSKSFCDGAFAAMKRADKAIEYIEPVVKTDDPKHPALARYNDGTICPNRRDPSETTYGGDTRDIGDRAYRLYRIDAANRFKNGLEEIVYGEQIIPKPEGSILWAKLNGYQQVNFDECEHYPLVDVTPQDYHAHGMKEALNAMLRYRGKYYVVKLDRSSSPGVYISLDFHAYKPSKGGHAHFPLACYWKFLTIEPSGE